MKYGMIFVAVCTCCCNLLFAEESKVKDDVYVTNYGLFCFSIQDAERIIVTDPFDSSVIALSTPSINASIVVLSHKQTKKSVFEILKGSYQVIKSNGFYRVMAIPFNGFKINEGNIVYTWKIGDLKFAYLGNFQGIELDTQSLFRFKDTDVLFFPVGNYSADSMQAVWELIDKINPRIVIPMYYKVPEIAKLGFPKELEPFIALQKGSVVVVEERVFKVNKNTLPKERKVYVLPYKEIKKKEGK